MERRFNRNLSNESRGSSKNLQRIIAENRKPASPVPDLTDFMNDMFFGTPSPDKKTYNLKGINTNSIEDDDDFDSSTRSVSSRLTQEWLQEAKQMVASSPGRRSESPPGRLVTSPRFATSHARIDSPTEGRDPLSRSARRHRSVVGFSEEILSKTAKHNRNKSEPLIIDPPSAGTSPSSNVQDWFSNIFKPTNDGPTDPTSPKPNNEQPALTLPPRQSISRRTRFHTNSNAPQPHSINSPKRTFKIPATGSTDNVSHFLDDKPLSPPKSLIESSHRRSISSTTCSIPVDPVLSPPRNFVESNHRRSISASTCAFEKVLRKNNVNGDEAKEEDLKSQELNRFLKEQRDKIDNVFSGQIKGKAKIVLSGPSNSTSSMVAAICYAWLLENRTRANEQEGGEANTIQVVVPVMNMTRRKMLKQRQVARLFHLVGLDAKSLLFSDEVDLETLLLAKQLSILVVGEDILKTNGEAVSGCTVLTDNYCEEAYELLQTPILKKLLLAGILLDTQNLSASSKVSMTRDVEAVQLLSVGSSPNYRNAFFDQLMQDPKDDSFVEVMRQNYGNSPIESSHKFRAHQVLERNSTPQENTPSSDKISKDVKNGKINRASPNTGKPTISPIHASPASPAKPADASRGKNKTFFLAKWFGFGK
ncbi:hypothetical protein H5410_017882 [Solanum commersonii]|uniref:Uncharacterized protein n=1 Tax=Solanum commersonii TaxID=4109 RepID=A0A9J6A195_SOLCO|nr:hypothetical protein H5410_017882 [Solanum commersonii]